MIPNPPVDHKKVRYRYDSGGLEVFVPSKISFPATSAQKNANSSQTEI